MPRSFHGKRRTGGKTTVLRRRRCSWCPIGSHVSTSPMLRASTLDEQTLDRDTLAREVARRRTFAIISHPDAGKTTLTEKPLLYAGAIELAGAVRGRNSRRHA